MAKDIPISEITLRRYEKPYKTEKRELMRKICLSLGLLQPGDSRDVMVDILLVLNESAKSKTPLSSDDISMKAELIRKSNSLDTKGLAESNIRRQLKRLRDTMIVDKKNNLYNLTEFLSLKEIFSSKIERFLLPQILERTKEYLDEIEKS
jgi:hypothetical protein